MIRNTFEIFQLNNPRKIKILIKNNQIQTNIAHKTFLIKFRKK